MTPSEPIQNDPDFIFRSPFLYYLVTLLFLITIIFFTHYQIFVNHDTQTIQHTDILNTTLAKRSILGMLHDVVSDLRFLAEHNINQHHFDTANDHALENLTNELFYFMKNKPSYDQIRFIESNGNEVVRINSQQNKPIIIQQDLLQNKKDRYYFSKTMSLSRNEIYWSPFDLNIEQNAIERPFKPTIRIGTPVFDQHNNKIGILLLNFLGNKLIDTFKTITLNIQDRMMLVNQNGFWLIHKNPENEWGFMFNNNKTFANSDPDAWKIISHKESGQFVDQHGMYTFNTLHPQDIGLDYLNQANPIHLVEPSPSKLLWKIISHASLIGSNKTILTFIKQHLMLYFLLLIILMTGVFQFAKLQFKRKSAEKQNEYERGFRHILENVPMAAISIASDEIMFFVNHYFLAITGWDKKDIIGKHWRDVFIPENQYERAELIFSKARDKQTLPQEYEINILTKNGSQRCFSWNNTLTVNQNVQFVAITCMGHDITEKKQTAEKLSILSSAVEQSPSTVMITNNQGFIEYVNPKFVQLTGYLPHDVIGKTPKILQSGEMSQDAYQDLWQTISQGKKWQGEFHNKRKDGTLYWESALISAIINEQGEIKHYLAIKEDITEQKQLREMIQERNLEIQKNKELAAIGRMSSMVAHDLRNPLSSIKMGLQILSKKAIHSMGEAEQELIQISRQQIRHMEEILTDMLTYSKAEKLKLSWLSIDKILDLAISIVQKQIDERNILVKTSYQSGLPTIYADATRLRQVFSNLISNAAEATENINTQQPEITVDAHMILTNDGPKMEISITDNGCGINPELGEKIFEPFYTTRASGTGLGLSIVQQIIVQHQGKIQLTPVDSGGTRCLVLLPIAPASAPEPELRTIK